MGMADSPVSIWMVFDIDGTREAIRQRALPRGEDLPPTFRRLDDVCAPGYRGRKRGEVVRTRTTVSQAHNYQWLSSFGNRGSGSYREELRISRSSRARCEEPVTGRITTSLTSTSAGCSVANAIARATASGGIANAA